MERRAISALVCHQSSLAPMGYATGGFVGPTSAESANGHPKAFISSGKSRNGFVGYANGRFGQVLSGQSRADLGFIRGGLIFLFPELFSTLFSK